MNRTMITIIYTIRYLPSPLLSRFHCPRQAAILHHRHPLRHIRSRHLHLRRNLHSHVRKLLTLHLARHHSHQILRVGLSTVHRLPSFVVRWVAVSSERVKREAYWEALTLIPDPFYLLDSAYVVVGYSVSQLVAPAGM